MLSTTSCAEQQRLRERYHTAIRAYKEMIAALENVLSPSEFEEVCERSEGVRLLFDVARKELRKHLLTHGFPVMESATGHF
jgi:hypothetical protein